MYSDTTKPLTQDQLNLFCKAWADHGYDDPTDQYFVLFSGGDAAERPKLAAIEAIGTDVGLPMEIRDGELWVPKTQQIHDEIGARWI